MKRFLTLTLLMCLFVSCNEDENKEKDAAKIRAGQELNTDQNRALDSDEFAVAKTICKAIEEKNADIQGWIGFSKRFFFNRYKKGCGTSERQISGFSASLTAPEEFGDIPEFISASDGNKDKQDFVYKVFVEKDPFIKDVCDKVAKDEKPKIIESLDSYKVKYRFFGRNKLELALYRNQGGKMLPYLFNIYTIETNSNSDRYGMVLERYSGSYCRSNNQDISYIRQLL